MATDSVYVMAAGDIANGTSATSRWAQTGKLLDSWEGVNSPLYILPLGDNAYNDGTLAEFNNYFDPYWGTGGTQSGYTWKNKFADLYPVPGNHEARLSSTYAGYESYFGAAAHAATSYHWSQELTASDGNKYWRVIGLDSNVMSNAAQITYLRAQLLAATTAGPGGTDQHVIIIFHHPLWTPGGYSPGIAGIGGTASNGASPNGIIAAIQDATYQGGIKIIMNGHDHLYARYNPLRAGTYSTATGAWAQTPSTVAAGFIELLVGTGGNAPDALAASPNMANVAHYRARTSTNADGGSGVMKMDLRSDRAICQFVTIDNTATGVVEDSFTIQLTSTPPTPGGTGAIQDIPMTTPRFWDTAFANVAGSNSRHEGRPQAVEKVTGDDWIYVGGNFNRVQDIVESPVIDYSFNNIARYNAHTGNLDTTWDMNLNGQVKWMDLSDDESLLFVVGDFTTVGSTTRNHIAAFNTSDGSLNTSYFSGFACNGNVNGCVVDGNYLYVGGTFTSIGGSTRNRAAKLDVSTSSVTVDATWNPNVSQNVNKLDLAIDGVTHKIAMNIDPQGTVNGTGTHSIALVNTTTGTKYWGANPNAGGGYVMWVDDSHNGGQLYFGSRGSGGNILFAYSYAGVQQWWYDSNGDIQGGGSYRELSIVAKHDTQVAPAKNVSWTSSNGVPGEGFFVLNKDGVLQSSWMPRFRQGGSTDFSSLRCFGAFSFVESDFACVIVTGEYGQVLNTAGTQTKSPAPWRLAQFNESGTTPPASGTHGWSVGYWDGDWWGSSSGAAQSATVTIPPNGVGQFSFAGTAPVVTVENTADVTAIAPAGQFNLTAAVPIIEVNGIPIEVTAPAGQFGFAVGTHGVDSTSVTISLRRPHIPKSLDQDAYEGRVER